MISSTCSTRAFNQPNTTPFQVLDKVPHVIAPSVSHDNPERVVQAETSEDPEDVQANTTTLLRTAREPEEVCEGVITAVPAPAEESVAPVLVPPLPATAPPSSRHS